MLAQNDQQERILESLKETLSAKHLSGTDEPVDAVVGVLVQKQTKNDLSLLLIHRAEQSNDPWSGQIGLPGGRVEPSDTSSRAALKREVSEEIGVDLEHVGIELGTLSIGSPMRVLSLRVQPWVYGMTMSPKIKTGPEVQEAFWVDVSRLPSLRTTVQIDIRGTPRTVDAFSVNGHVVWGYTHRVLNELLLIMDSIV